jgi:hypothetical protein
MDTLASTDSILAILDWLDPSRSASSHWVKPRDDRRAFTLRARTSRMSINAVSSSVSPRKSWADPIFDPAFRNCFCFAELMASGANRGYGSGLRQPNAPALLEPMPAGFRLDPRDRGKRRRLDLAFQPDQGFVFAVHPSMEMSDSA